jgi:hypothetical protein
MLEALTGSLQQVAGYGEIHGGRRRFNMAKECGKMKQPRGGVGALTVPAEQCCYREAVTIIPSTELRA